MSDVDRERLLDIVESIDKILEYAPATRPELDTDSRTLDAIARRLGIIGEAANGISAGLRHQHEDVPWRRIIGMRHIIVHDYGNLDRDIVWTVIEQELRPLRASIQAILDA